MSRTALSPGSRVVVDGSGLGEVVSVTFLGRSGKQDDVAVRPARVSDEQLDAAVPARARSGKVQLRTSSRVAVHTRTVKVVPSASMASTVAAPAAPEGASVFPIRGKHDLGQGPTNDFGGARDHQGQDLFAKCGTPVVAVQAGTVRKVGFDGAGGNYAVLTSAIDGRDMVFMHLAAAPEVAEGQAVTAGQALGDVGQTGNANGCHLHFEIWTAPGYYVGGAPVDPLPDLKRWDALDAPHRHTRVVS